MSIINSNTIRPTITPSITTAATFLNPLTPIRPTSSWVSSTPISNLSQQTTAQISTGYSSPAPVPVPMPTRETIFTQGTEGDDLLQPNNSETQTLAPPTGYHGIYGKGGTDTLVFPKRFADYRIANSILGGSYGPVDSSINPNQLTITDRNLSSQPPRIINDIERFQFADVTLDRASLTDPLKVLNYNKQLWANQNIDNYIIRLERNSSSASRSTTPLGGDMNTGTWGPETSRGMAVVEVLNGEAASASLNQYTGHAGTLSGTSPDQTVDPQLARFTATSLFELIEQAMAEGKELDVQYNSQGLSENIRIGSFFRGEDLYFADLLSTIVPATEGNDKIEIASRPSPYLYTPGQISANQPREVNTIYRAGAGQDIAVFPGKLSDYALTNPFNTEAGIAIRLFKGEPITLQDFEVFQFADMTLSRDQLLDSAHTLDYYRELWQSQGLDTYSINLNKYNNNFQGSTAVQTSVVNDQIREVVAMGRDTLPSSPPDPELAQLTIDKLFDLIQAGIDRGEKIYILYDHLGIPTQFNLGDAHYAVSTLSMGRTITPSVPTAPIPVQLTGWHTTLPLAPATTSLADNGYIEINPQIWIRLLLVLIQFLQAYTSQSH